MFRNFRAIAVVAFLLTAFGQAQDVEFGPHAIIINPRPDFSVQVWLDKAGERPSYQVGENVEISVQTDRDAFVYLFSLRADGRVTQILPNRFDQDNRLRAGRTASFPSQGAGYTFQVSPPTGEAHVVAVASTRELDVGALARFESGASFATSDIGVQGFQQEFQGVVRGVPQGAWVSDAIRYQVVRQGATTPAEATVVVNSEPRGATVFVDGRRQGVTPLRLSLQPGRRSLTIEADGYQSYARTLQLSPGGTTRVDAVLERSDRRGTVDFESDPRGADVYLDGSWLGTTPLRGERLQEGTYEVMFERSGYRSERRTLQVRAGQRDMLSVTLRPTTGTLRVSANVGGAEVFLDGRRVGSIPSGDGRLTVEGLDPGTYELTVVAPGYNTWVDEVRIRSGERTEVQVRQQRR